LKNSPYTKTGLPRLVAAFTNSIAGLRSAWRCEAAFRQEVTLTVLLLPVAVWAPVSSVERLLLGGSLILVLIVELLNSAIETAIDRVSLDRHELSARAKDIGSAAVLLSLLLCAAIWVTILYPVFFSRP
jgi:diacylglycerol kinase (ATP)